MNLITSGTHIFIGPLQVWDEGTEEDLARDRNSAKRTLVCRWEHRHQLVHAIRGDVTQSVGGVDIMPAEPYGDIPHLYPDKFKIRGIGAMSSTVAGTPSYQYARVEVSYITIDQGELGLEVGSQVITLPKSGPSLRFVGGEEVPYQDTTGKPMVVMTLTKSMVRLPAIPVEKIVTAAKAPMNASSFLGAEPGTVLFDGGRATRYTYASAQSGVLYDVQYRFLCRPALKWDHLYHRNGTEFDAKKVEFLNGDPYVASSDLNALFEP